MDTHNTTVKMNKLNKIYRATISILTLIIFIGLSSGLSYAAKSSKNSSTSTPSSTSSVSPILQSFNAEKGVYPGMLVSVDPKLPGSVIPLTENNIDKMLGSVVPFNSANISISPANGSSQQVLVAESGKYYVLVSNEGGNISSGDGLTMSSIAGIAKKASSLDKTLIGQADGSFNGKTDVISSVALKSTSGAADTYAIGSILINLHLGQNSQYAQSTGGLPQFIIQAAYAIANKPVSPARIYLGFIVIFAVIIIVSTMFYSGTRSGIISIGRNPLGQKSIAKGLIQTILGGLAVFAIGVGIVYAVIAL